MKQTYETGLAGEETAEQYLAEMGMVCLERRYRNKCGEIEAAAYQYFFESKVF